MSQIGIRVTPLSAAVGAVISGVDLAAALNDDDFAANRQAFLEHGAIFFREQQLSPERHIAFTRRWAPIVINRFFKAALGYPEIVEIRKEPDQTTNFGGDWHMDHSDDEVPAMDRRSWRTNRLRAVATRCSPA